MHRRRGASSAPIRRSRWKKRDALIDKDIDPRVVEKAEAEKAARDAALRIQHSVAAVVEEFVADKLQRERSGKIAARDLRNVFVAEWGERLITDITEDDVLAIVKKKQRRAPEQARALLILVKRFFVWALDQRSYGLTASPCDRLKATKIIGELKSRTRRLNDAEIFALWRASGRMGYPIGSVYRTLLLTGLRLNEAAGISWPEIHGNAIVIPAERMKGREGKAREHLVPITQAMQDVIASVPRNGKYLFSLKDGKSPVSMTGPMKVSLDRRMLRTLKAMARRRGENHRDVDLPDWVNHDLRRTLRSGLSALRVPHEVKEAVLAHRQGGVVAIYDVHQYEDEKREALQAWAQHIADIVNPPVAKVVKLRARRR
jgi:integrase